MLRKCGASLRGPIETCLWALDLHDTPSLNPRHPTLAALDALPFVRWEPGLEDILDELGQQVAARLVELSEAAA
jgi:hypothetical protein